MGGQARARAAAAPKRVALDIRAAVFCWRREFSCISFTAIIAACVRSFVVWVESALSEAMRARVFTPDIRSTHRPALGSVPNSALLLLNAHLDGCAARRC